METDKEFTFGGVASSQFEEAIQTARTFFYGIANAPLTKDNELAIVYTALHGMMLDKAHRAYIRKLEEFRQKLESDNMQDQNASDCDHTA